MASTRQIEHLERKHKENPEGLTFAPLANAYRNSGQPERAIEILMHGLEYHSDHAPARIVLGRCHLDLGDDSAAESAFAQVLDLDKENVVALKALADITERASRYDDAARWLGYLLEVDRNNEEAREQLDRVNNTKAIAEEGGIEPSGEAWAPETAQEPEADQEAEVAEAVAEEAEPPTLDSPWGEAREAGEEPVEDVVEDVVTEDIEPPAQTQPSPWEPPAIAGEVTETLGATGLDGPGGPSRDEPAAEVPEEHSDEIDFATTIETEDPISLTPGAHNEFQAPDAALGLSPLAKDDNEFQVEKEGGPLDLHGSEHNEFQQPSDAEFLRPSVEDDIEDQDAPVEAEETSPEPEAIESRDTGAGSWFSPASEESATVAPELQPDGTPEPLDDVPSGFEAAEPAETPFEESEPLPSPWGPAGDLGEVARPETDEPPPVESESVEESETVSGPETTADDDAVAAGGPGSWWAAEMGEDTEEQGDADDERYPEVLGSDQDQAEPVEVEEPAPEVAQESEPAIVATETMAEVYLSQGHRFEALEVYRTLLESTPGDARLSEKVSALENELESGKGSDVDSSPSFAASTGGGQTVKDMFRGLLATKPATESPATPPAESAPAGSEDSGDASGDLVGEPTRPAQDSLSLSAVFGEDSSPVPPAVGGGSSEAAAGDGFSFDSFFGDEESSSGPKGPSGSTSKVREDEEDLDQFQSWLQGLKG